MSPVPQTATIGLQDGLLQNTGDISNTFTGAFAIAPRDPTISSFSATALAKQAVLRGLYLPLSEAMKLIPLITGVAEAELDKQRIEEHIAEVLTQYEADLQKADGGEFWTTLCTFEEYCPSAEISNMDCQEYYM
ncbi:MAG: hypothetical protein HC788_14830 [Sphingopyxis sp.]|nr:hypothetical protein [Sphingopyxis sp.]